MMDTNDMPQGMHIYDQLVGARDRITAARKYLMEIEDKVYFLKEVIRT
jgi:hypothetical protein